MAKRIALGVVLVWLAGCNVIETSGGPLTREECAQLQDKFHEIFSQGLTGADLAEFNADRDREAEIAECVEEQNWGRAGFECSMKQKSEDGLKRCILRMR